MPPDGVVGLLLSASVFMTSAESSVYSYLEAGSSLCLLFDSCYKLEVAIPEVEAPSLFLFLDLPLILRSLHN